LAHPSKDKKLIEYLSSYTDKDSNFWAFSGKAVNRFAFYQYPAMMVPKMQKELINSVRRVDKKVRTVFDPFVGSGTTLVESMLQGLDFYGQDINPLAVLICRTLSGPYHIQSLLNKTNKLFLKIDMDGRRDISVNFSGLQKWFKPNIAQELSIIKRAIQKEESMWVRRFFWIAMAETIRLTSNSRTSTYKLHIRPQEEIAERKLSSIIVFKNIVQKNTKIIINLKNELSSKNLLSNMHYKGNVLVDIGNSINKFNRENFDLLITSPPYGDNKTTVPYGQASYLPLQWIDLKDIDEGIDNSCLQSTSKIDSGSLGGSLADSQFKSKEIVKKSHTLGVTLDFLSSGSQERSKKVTSFFYDFNMSLDSIINSLKPGGFMIWVVGNRCVGGYTILLDKILTELLVLKGCRDIEKIVRQIPSKRMANKNQTSQTIHSESILMLQKGKA
jgi:hypothetical protein